MTINLGGGGAFRRDVFSPLPNRRQLTFEAFAIRLPPLWTRDETAPRRRIHVEAAARPDPIQAACRIIAGKVFLKTIEEFKEFVPPHMF